MISQWTAKQWATLHQHLSKPADMDIVHAVIEGAGLIEPSDWDVAAQEIAPWVHITSMFINVAAYGDKDVAIFLREVRRYVPKEEMVRLTLGTLVHTLSRSFEHQGNSVQHWNLLLQTVGAPIVTSEEPNSVGEWSL